MFCYPIQFHWRLMIPHLLYPWTSLALRDAQLTSYGTPQGLELIAASYSQLPFRLLE